MRTPIKCVFLIALHIGLYGCSAKATENISPDEYYQLLENTEKSFIDNNLEEVSYYLTNLSNAKSIEVPNYEAYFFEAIIDLENGNILEGKNKLNKFEIMLLVDSGHIDCVELKGVKSLKIVRAKMCAEYFYTYYQEPSALTQKKILRYWHMVHLAKQRYDPP